MATKTEIKAHERLDVVEKQLTGLEVEVHIQFKETFTRIKRLESILIGSSAAIILLLLKVAMF